MNLSSQKKLAKNLQKKFKEIYRTYNNGVSLKVIGEKYGVSRSTIGRIFKNKNLKIRNSSEAHKVFLSKKTQNQIKILLKKKNTLKKISKKLKIGKGVLNTFLKDKKLQPGIQYKELPEKKICSDYKKGITVAKLATKYNSNAKTIRSRLHKNNIQMIPSSKRLTTIVQNLNKHYIDLINTPKSLSTKAKELKVSKYILSERLKNNRYILRTKSEEQIIVNNEKNPNLKFDFFKKKTSLRDYWVGFIAADGNIGGVIGKKLRLSLSVSKKDKPHPYKLKKIIGGGSVTTFDFSRYDGKYYSEKVNKYISSGIQFKYQLDNTTVVRPILKLGIVPQKTHILRPSKNLIFSKDFWRGFIDGDGSLTDIKKTYKTSKRISTVLSLGTQSVHIYKYFLLFLKRNKITKPNINIKGKGKSAKFYTIIISGIRARTLAKKLYFKANKLGRLERKYNLAMEWLKYKSKRYKLPN
jgi:hypothetical protein